MRLHVVQRHTFAGSNARHGCDLVEHEILEFRGRDGHVAPAESGEVRESRVSTNSDAGLSGQADGAAEDGGVAGVKASRDADRGDASHQRGVVADGVGTEGLADVGVQVDRHGSGSSVQTKGHRVIAVPPCHADLAPPAIHGALP